MSIGCAVCSTLSSSDFKLENTATLVDVGPTPGKCGKVFLVFRGHMRMCVNLVDQGCIRSHAYIGMQEKAARIHIGTRIHYMCYQIR